MEAYARLLVLPNSSISIMEKKLLADKDDIEIIALGDSHAGDDLYINSDKYFNFARGSDSVPIMYFKLKFAHKRVPHLKIILLQADYHLFGHLSTLYDHMKQYKQYIDEPVDGELGNYPMKSDRAFTLYSLEENISPLLHKELIAGLLGKNKEAKREAQTGARDSAGEWASKPEKTRLLETEYRLKAQLYSKYLINDKAVGYYIKILEFADKNNLTVYLTRYPLSNEYLNGINKETEGRITGLYNDLAGKFDVKILDYRRYYENKQRFFFNSDHLNVPGAIDLGERVAADIGLNK